MFSVAHCAKGLAGEPVADATVACLLPGLARRESRRRGHVFGAVRRPYENPYVTALAASKVVIFGWRRPPEFLR